MRYLRGYNEELDPSTYRSAARGKAEIHGNKPAADKLHDFADKREFGGYQIAYRAMKDDGTSYIGGGPDYMATMTKPVVQSVFFGSVLDYSLDNLVRNTADDLVSDWMEGGKSLSVSMVVAFNPTKVLDIKSGAYSIGRDLADKLKGVGVQQTFYGTSGQLATFVIEVVLSSVTHGADEHYACPACGGAVTMDCYECDGEGTVWSDEADDYVDCPVCNATGTHTCGECRGERKHGTSSQMFRDSFVPMVVIRAIPGRPNHRGDTPYSVYRWVGLFADRSSAKTFLDRWPYLIEEMPSFANSGAKGAGTSLVGALVELVGVLTVHEKKSENYVAEVVDTISNIRVAAMTVGSDKGNAVKAATRGYSGWRNISAHKFDREEFIKGLGEKND